MNTTHSLTFTITMQGNTDVMEQFARRIGEGIGSVVQTVSVQPELPQAKRVSVKKYAEMTGFTERHIWDLCKKGKQKHEKNGRAYIIILD